MAAQPLSALIEALRRDSRIRQNASDAVSYLLDLLYYSEFRIFEQVASTIDGGDTVNLVGVKSGPNSNGAPLWLVSCVGTGSDPIPSRWDTTDGDMFAPRIDHQTGLLHGLGVNSGKLDFVLKVLAASRLKTLDLRRPLSVIALFGEEAFSSGLRGLLDGRQAPGAALVSAPTNLELCTRHPGCLSVRLEVSRRIRHRRMPPSQGIFEFNYHSESWHAQAGPDGGDAVERAFDLLERLRAHGDVRVLVMDAGEAGNRIGGRFTMTVATSKAALPELPRDISVKTLDDGVSLPFPVDALLEGWMKARNAGQQAVMNLLNPPGAARDRSTIKPTHVGQLSTGRDRATGTCMFWPRREHAGQTRQFVEAFAAAAQHSLRGFDELEISIQVLQDRPAFDCSEHLDGPAYTSFRQACREHDVAPVTSASRVTTDAGLLAAVGVETIVYGPGIGAGGLYRDDEGIPLVQVERALRIYESFLRSWCL